MTTTAKATQQEAAIARMAFPPYKRIVSPRGRKIISDPQWQGIHIGADCMWMDGTRITWAFVRLGDGMVLNPTDAIADSCFHAGGGDQIIDLIPGLAAVQAITFCGKQMGLRVHMHPDDRQKLIA